jgi:AcrR family transcriptional regulator
MPRIKQQDREQFLSQTRQRLLDAATLEFARSGYEGANINTISTAAGYAKGTIYNYFPSKRALLLALVDFIAGFHHEFIAERVLTETDPVRRLERLYQAGFDFVSQHPSRARVMFNIVYSPDEEFKGYIFQAYQPTFQFVADEILIPGMSQETFRTVDPFSMAILLMTIYLGTASQVNAEGKPYLNPAEVAALILSGLQQ